MIRRPPHSTLTYTPCPYTTFFRSESYLATRAHRDGRRAQREPRIEHALRERRDGVDFDLRRSQALDDAADGKSRRGLALQGKAAVRRVEREVEQALLAERADRAPRPFRPATVAFDPNGKIAVELQQPRDHAARRSGQSRVDVAAILVDR